MRRDTLSIATALAAFSLWAAACHSGGDAVVVVVVTASGTPASVTSLNVTITGPAGASSKVYPSPDGEPITAAT